MNRYLKSFVFTLTLLSGCAVGPDFVSPQIDFIDKWSTKLPQNSPPEERDLVKWWGLFNDDVLNALLRKGVAQNFDIEQARTRLLQARSSVRIAFSGILPSAGISSQYRRSGGSSGAGASTVSGGTVLQGREGARDFYQAGFDAAWEIDIFGGIRREIESAEAQRQAAHYSLNDIQRLIVAEIATRYFTIRGLQVRLSVAHWNLDTQRQSADIARQRYEAGFAGRLDVANAEAQVASTYALIPTIIGNIERETFALSTLMGEPSSEEIKELRWASPLPPSFPSIPVALPSEVLRRRPDVRQAEEELHSATADIGASVADLLPRFSLTSLISLQGDSVKDISNWSERLWNASGGITQPLFQGGRLLATLERSRAVERERFAAYRQTVIVAIQDVETSLSAYRRENERKDALVSAVTANRSALETSTRLYSDGLGDFLEVLNAERSLFSSQDALAQSQQNAVLNLIALFKALGGGWNYD